MVFRPPGAFWPGRRRQKPPGAGSGGRCRGGQSAGLFGRFRDEGQRQPAEKRRGGEAGGAAGQNEGDKRFQKDRAGFRGEGNPQKWPGYPEFVQDGAGVGDGKPFGEHAEDEGMVKAEMDAGQDEGDGGSGFVDGFPDGPAAVEIEDNARDGDPADADGQKGRQQAKGNAIAENGSGRKRAAGEPRGDGGDPQAVGGEVDNEKGEEDQSGDFMIRQTHGPRVVQQNHRDQNEQVECEPDSGFKVHVAS